MRVAAERARGFGDPTRLSLAAALADADELCVCDLAWISGRSQNLVSHHAGASCALPRRVAKGREDGDVLAHRRWPNAARGGRRRSGARMSTTMRPSGCHPAGPAASCIGGMAPCRASGSTSSWISSPGWEPRAWSASQPASSQAPSRSLGSASTRSSRDSPASVIVWRFTGSRMHSQKAEARAHRIVAIQFFILAPYVAYEAISKLVHADHPDTSWLGIALVTTSAISMPLLGRASSDSPTHSVPARRTARGRRPCCADTSRWLCWQGCSGTRCSAGGGSTRSPCTRDCRARDPRGTSKLARRELLRILLATRRMTMGRDFAWGSPPRSSCLFEPCRTPMVERGCAVGSARARHWAVLAPAGTATPGQAAVASPAKSSTSSSPLA